MTPKQKKIIQGLEVKIQRQREMLNERSERIGRGETDIDDCFVSDRMNQLSISVALRKIEIVKNGGLSEFDVLRDMETGEIVSKKVVNGKYGPCWLTVEEPQIREKYGTFIGYARRESTYNRKGLETDTVLLPAWVKTKASGAGMVGAFNSRVITYQSDRNMVV